LADTVTLGRFGLGFFVLADFVLDVTIAATLACKRSPPFDIIDDDFSFLWKHGFDAKSPTNIDCDAGTKRSGSVHADYVRCDVATLVAKILFVIEQELNGRIAMNDFCKTVIHKTESGAKAKMKSRFSRRCTFTVKGLATLAPLTFTA
jgi:hypothetical protein